MSEFRTQDIKIACLDYDVVQTISVISEFHTQRIPMSL